MAKGIFLAISSLLIANLAHADIAVSTVGNLLVTNDTVKVTLSTVAAGQIGAPADMPDPVFWLDASDTNGWTITTDSTGYTRVKTVPSKSNSGRYATVDVSAENGDTWYGWKITETSFTYPRSPYFIEDRELKPGVALDFLIPGGTGESPRIGLVFNKVSEFDGATPTNAIFNIGTVIAVYGSHDGRGWFLGGGRSSEGKTYEWNRNVSDMRAKGYDWTSPAIWDRPGLNDPQSKGVLRHDGLPTNPRVVGMNHSWEVLSWIMNSADAVATGIGIGDTRDAGHPNTGQQRIAEMLIFDEVLSVAMVEKIETYLNEKWFGRKSAGQNGKAHIGTLRSLTPSNNSDETTGLETIVDVASKEVLMVDRLEGGRGLKSVIRKTGDGELSVKDAKEYGGRIALAGGTLRVFNKKIPSSIEKLVTNCYYHADASVVSSVSISEEDGKEYVMALDNLASGTFGGHKLILAPIMANRRPVLKRDALGSGRNVLDFGAQTYGADTGGYLSFCTNTVSEQKYPRAVKVKGLITVIAVVSARGSGWNIFNKVPYCRTTTSVDNYLGWCNYDMFDASVYDTTRGLSASNSVMFIDGVRRDAVGGFFSRPGFQVVAVRASGCDGIERLGCSSENVFGGLELAEIFIFRRQLTDDEMTDISAYLANKWFDTELAGYASSNENKNSADIAVLDVEQKSEFKVASGDTARIGKLKLKAPLSIVGGGTLEVEEIDNSSVSTIDAQDSLVKVVGPNSPSTMAELAKDPAFHLDPTVSGNFDTELVNGTNFVCRAHDKSWRYELFAPASARRPYLDSAVLSSGLPVLNFGPYGYYGMLMAFDRSIEAVRSVYAVWAANDTGSGKYVFMFGSTDRFSRDPLGGRLYDYHCGQTLNSEGLLPLFDGKGSQSHITGGEIYVDGVRTNRLFAPRKGEFRLIELHHLAPAHIAALATDRRFAESGRNGGSMFGETLIYTRELSEREKVATRNYLMKKWFGKKDDELQSLPDEPDVGFKKLAGSGSFVKEGGNTVSVVDVSSYTGTLSVAEGTLRIERPLPGASPRLVTDGLVFHVDANEGVELVPGTENSVAQWHSRLNDGWSAVAGKDVFDNHQYASYPTLRTGMYDNTPFVRMDHNYQCMVFCKDGVRSRIKNIKTVFWVFGTDDNTGSTLGGGFLLGGGNAKNAESGASQYDWHRGGTDCGAYRRSFVDPLTSDSATAAVRDGKWFLNGAEVNGREASLGSNAWHYITAKTSAIAANPATADGFAFDGRLIENILAGKNEEVRHRTGGQSLAEVLIYDRHLSESERKEVEAYLTVKWGFSQNSRTNNIDLVVASGAELELAGGNGYFNSIVGAGNVDGDITVAKLLADGEATEFVNVDGAFVMPGKISVELRNLPEKLNGATVKILNCSELVLPDGGVEVEFSGESLPDGAKAKLVHSQGALSLRFNSQGLRLIVR